ncbi:hypothetical protein ACUN0C_18945 [Faunimonas sp. B44]|uniref:hypothetical protein n=1 Tax=Faunimonas sp. B44 TaxID=3461493 RepID=UPI004044EFE2
MADIGYEKCPCGVCSKYFLTGIGDFVQGSGFTLEEAERVVTALNAAETLRAERDRARKAYEQVGERLAAAEADNKNLTRRLANAEAAIRVYMMGMKAAHVRCKQLEGALRDAEIWLNDYGAVVEAVRIESVLNEVKS